jgi:prepilin-type N-terminal cleavage/methylation domain-containing protein
MKAKTGLNSRRRPQWRSGFSLIEVVVGMGLVAMLLGALFSSFTSGGCNLEMARDNLRATQILAQNLEMIRLCRWDQVAAAAGSLNAVPTGFTNYYTPNDPLSTPVYRGTVAISNVTFSSSYASDLRQVTVRVDWQTGGVNRTRQVTTLVSP